MWRALHDTYVYIYYQINIYIYVVDSIESMIIHIHMYLMMKKAVCAIKQFKFKEINKMGEKGKLK